MNAPTAPSRARLETLLAASGVVLSPFPDAPPFDFRIQHGEHWLLLGGTRSGKTPLLKTLLGLMSPGAGAVNLFGQSLSELAPSQLLRLRQRVGTVFAADGLLPAWSGLENLALPLRYHDVLPPAEIIDRIEAYAGRYAIPAHWLDGPVASLSREKRAALSLVRALIIEPELLIIDGIPFDAIEAFSGIKSTQLLEDAMASECSVIVSLPEEVGERLPGFLRQTAFKTARMQGGQLQCVATESRTPNPPNPLTLDDHAQATRS